MRLVKALLEERSMNILLYTGASEEWERGLTECIGRSLPERDSEIYRTMDDFCDRLLHPMDNPFIAILLAPNYDELLKIFRLRHLLQDHPIILILPDQEEETLAIAHRLRPRFLRDLSGNQEEIIAVLSKMLLEEDHPFYRIL
jgi:hypothetical protein